MSKVPKKSANGLFLKVLLCDSHLHIFVCFIYVITALKATDVHFTGWSWSFHVHFTCLDWPFDVFVIIKRHQPTKQKGKGIAASHQ